MVVRFRTMTLAQTNGTQIRTNTKSWWDAPARTSNSVATLRCQWERKFREPTSKVENRRLSHLESVSALFLTRGKRPSGIESASSSSIGRVLKKWAFLASPLPAPPAGNKKKL